MIMKVFFRRGKWSNAPRLGEEGSALVELGLSLPILSVMLLAAVEFAQVAYVSIETTNAAHAAAVYAATSHGHVSDSTGITNAATGDAGNLAGILSVTSVVATCSCSDGTKLASCSDNSTCLNSNTSMVTAVTVQTQSTFSPLFHIPAVGPSFTLHGTSTQVVSNQ
jgi:Flp pilus assembly protein TadG